MPGAIRYLIGEQERLHPSEEDGELIDVDPDRVTGEAEGLDKAG